MQPVARLNSDPLAFECVAQRLPRRHSEPCR
jgi:hypothetical protein